MANGYAVALCMVKNMAGGPDTEIFCRVFQAKSSAEALGLALIKAKEKYHDRQIGAFTVNEFDFNATQ